QSADLIGDGLRVSARCTEDGIIEAVEGTAPDHFVLAVQWHPERSVQDDEPSRAIFRAFIEAARASHGALAGEVESVLLRFFTDFRAGFASSSTTAWAIAASSVARPSGVLAFIPILSPSIPMSSATFRRIAAVCGPIFGAARISVESRLVTK